MKISEILNIPISPFDESDDKLRRLFSFFLYSAPTIDSKSAAIIEESRLAKNWQEYISNFSNDSYSIIGATCKIEAYFEKYKINDQSEINRRAKGFVCKRKDSNETDCKCVLRHIRNAIAHGHVYMCNAGNRKYILFEDFNKGGKQSSRMLFSQSDLKKLKDTIMK